jgi:hypothetical protein
MSIRRSVLVAMAVAVAMVGVLVAFGGRHSTVRPRTAEVVESGGPAFDPIRADEVRSILPQDAIPALIKPAYLAASQAADISDHEMVIGVVSNGDARAYPLSTLSVHEIVDDDIGGQPVAVTW